MHEKQDALHILLLDVLLHGEGTAHQNSIEKRAVKRTECVKESDLKYLITNFLLLSSNICVRNLLFIANFEAKQFLYMKRPLKELLEVWDIVNNT